MDDSSPSGNPAISRTASANVPASGPVPGRPPAATLPLHRAWLALVALTLLSVILAETLHGRTGLPILVAMLVWIKGRVVARRFLESDDLHPFLRNVLRVFIAFAPIVLAALALWPLLRDAVGR